MSMDVDINRCERVLLFSRRREQEEGPRPSVLEIQPRQKNERRKISEIIHKIQETYI